MSKSFTINYGGQPHHLFVQLGEYQNGRLAVQVFDEKENCWTVSINMPMVDLGPDEFVFKTYTENSGLVEAMISAGIIEETGRSVDVGFAGPQPICRLVKI